MKLIIKGIELSTQETKVLDAAYGIINEYVSKLEHCGIDSDVIETVENTNEIILSIAGGTFYDEYIEEDD